MTPRGLARIGSMMLNTGMWGGRCVVPAQWIESSTSPMVDVDDECARQRSVRKAHREGVIQHAARPGWRHRPPDSAAVLIEPGGHLSGA